MGTSRDIATRRGSIALRYSVRCERCMRRAHEQHPLRRGALRLMLAIVYPMLFVPAHAGDPGDPDPPGVPSSGQ